MEKRVIDISSWNGLIDFGKVKAEGISGVIIRAGATGYGSTHTKFKDERFDANYAGAKAAGLEVGAYYYSCAMTEDEAETEANVFLELLDGKQFDLPVYMDVEETNAPSDMRTLGKDKLTAIIVKFCETMEKAGYYAGVYSGKYWARDYFDAQTVSRFTFWLAHWVDATDFSGAYDMWQHSATGWINGVNGDVDLNYQYKDFSTIIKPLGLNGFPAAKPEEPNKPEPGEYFVRVGFMQSMDGARKLAEELAGKGYVVTVDRRGDLDGDGAVTAADARIGLRLAVGLDA